MSKKINCPNCKSDNVRSVDNQPIWHPTASDIKNGVSRYDNEIYISFTCDNCKSDNFTVAFDIVPKKKLIVKIK